MRKSLYSFIALVSLTLTACSTVLDNLPGVYSLEIQQGNMVDQDMIDQLKPNMTKKQVLYIMGSPMLVDVFHQKRWDYLYSKQLDSNSREQKKISLYFESDVLVGIQGDFRPDSQAVKPIKETTVDVPARDLEKTLWEKIVWLFSDEPEPKIINNKEDEDTKAAVTPLKPDSKPVDKKSDKEAPTTTKAVKPSENKAGEDETVTTNPVKAEQKSVDDNVDDDSKSDDNNADEGTKVTITPLKADDKNAAEDAKVTVTPVTSDQKPATKKTTKTLKTTKPVPAAQ